MQEEACLRMGATAVSRTHAMSAKLTEVPKSDKHIAQLLVVECEAAEIKQKLAVLAAEIDSEKHVSQLHAVECEEADIKQRLAALESQKRVISDAFDELDWSLGEIARPSTRCRVESETGHVRS